MSMRRPAIAIIEKDHAALEMYRRTLTQEYDVFPCASIGEARQVIEQCEINAVVWEPMEFGHNRWDFFHEMKAEPRSANIPVIVCSTLEVRNLEAKKELAACLVKPVLPSDLSLVVQYVLANVPKK